MCVGAVVASEPTPLANLAPGPFRKRESSKGGATDERKEKSRDAARNRRAKESDYFQDLEEMLPVSGPPPNSQMTSIDKTSLIRLTVAHLKSRDVIENAGLQKPEVKDELDMSLDILDTLDGFSIIISQDGDVIFVSETVTNFVGLTSFELLGSNLGEFVHPCDHGELGKLHPAQAEAEDQNVEVFVRVKCTITDRGRMINLKQANYKALKLSGKARYMKKRDEGGVHGIVFMGLGTLVGFDMASESNMGVFVTKHTADLKFTDSEGWLTEQGRYDGHLLAGTSFFQLVYTEDLPKILPAFKNLKEHGHCETQPYRLLVGGGGWVWLQTKAGLTNVRRGSTKGQTVTCRHSLITEIVNPGQVFSLVQTEARKTATAGGSTRKRTSKMSTSDTGTKGSGSSKPQMGRVKASEKPKPEPPKEPEVPDSQGDSFAEVLDMLNQDAKDLESLKEEKLCLDFTDENICELLDMSNIAVLEEACSLALPVFELDDQKKESPVPPFRSTSVIVGPQSSSATSMKSYGASTAKMMAAAPVYETSAIGMNGGAAYPDFTPPVDTKAESFFSDLTMSLPTVVTAQLFEDDEDEVEGGELEGGNSQKLMGINTANTTENNKYLIRSDTLSVFNADDAENANLLELNSDADLHPTLGETLIEPNFSTDANKESLPKVNSEETLLRALFGTEENNMEKYSPFMEKDCVLLKDNNGEDIDLLSLDDFNDFDIPRVVKDNTPEQEYDLDNYNKQNKMLRNGMEGVLVMPEKNLMWSSGNPSAASPTHYPQHTTVPENQRAGIKIPKNMERKLSVISSVRKGRPGTVEVTTYPTHLQLQESGGYKEAGASMQVLEERSKPMVLLKLLTGNGETYLSERKPPSTLSAEGLVFSLGGGEIGAQAQQMGNGGIPIIPRNGHKDKADYREPQDLPYYTPYLSSAKKRCLEEVFDARKLSQAPCTQTWYNRK